MNLEENTEQSLLTLIFSSLAIELALFTFLAKKFNSNLEYFEAVGRGLAGFFIGTIFFHIIAVLYGAPLLDVFDRTLYWSALLSSLCAVPLTCTLGFDQENWRRVLFFFEYQSSAEDLSAIPALASVLGAWIGAIPIPLDWDRPWQVWPISCTYGAIGGYLLGLFFAFMKTRVWPSVPKNHLHND